MVATVNMLQRNQVIAYIGAHAAEYGLDPAAMLAVANHEGLNTSPGAKWWLPGEANYSFGPPSWYGNGAGAAILHMFGGNSDQAAAWSWSADGLNYWMQQIAASGAKGLHGVDAIRAIVTGFERPRADLVQGEISNATKDYVAFQQAIAGSGSIAIPTSPTTTPGQTDTGAQPTTGGQTTVTTDPTSGSAGMLKLGQVGPFQIGVPSGLLLGLIAIVLLLIGAIVLLGGNRDVQQAAIMAAKT